MSNSSAIKAMVALTSFTATSAFVAPAHLGKTLSNPAVPAPNTHCVPSRSPPGRGAAVAPLSGFFLPSITDFFDRADRATETCLPQDEQADQEARAEQLKEARLEYQWNMEGVPVGAPFLDGYPDQEFPAAPWLLEVAKTAVIIITGTLRGTIGASEVLEALSSPENARNFATRISDLTKENVSMERADDIDDYEDLHAFPVRNPDTQYDWEDDDTFARLRLQGANCVVIKKATAATRAKLTILDTDPSYAEFKNKVDSLLAAGKLFVVDQELVDGMETSAVDGWQKYLTPSIALFEMIEDDLLPIKPIGIQLSQGAEPTPIFFPGEGYNWQIAKACFEGADFIIHEVVSHLGNTHVVLEGALVSMHRQLPKEHPLYDLLHPHVEGTAFINFHAQDSLIAVGGTVDKLTANSISETWDLCLAQTVDRISSDFSPEADFAHRGMTKEDFPGRYMYRDIGTQYWEATHTWVKEYLDIYYTSDKDVEEDYELQAFITEMTDTAAMKWLEEYKTTTDKKAFIAKVFASFIYTASTLHAAVNFPQKPSMSFVPSSPGAMYAPPPTDKSARNQEDYMQYLVPMEIALTHVAVLTLLGSIHHTQLGEYSNDNFDDDRVNTPLKKYQEAIDDINDELEETNSYLSSEWRKRGKSRREAKNFAYKELLAKNIPQSINI
eukprot:jgi/Undpi1/3507/HiC_scaffold_16.g06879.m1